LDRNIEREVHENIESISDNHGTVIVAHRLSTVKNADRIYTVKGGRVVEVGTHQELLGKDGVYAELYTEKSEVRR
jgi:subfamily B ATP-binding cassette protein MsbA